MPPSSRSDQNRSLLRTRKWPRLRTFDYRGTHAYSLTLCCADKRAVFADGEVVLHATEILREQAEHLHFRVWAYCFMPDHLHLLVEGIVPASDLKKFMRSFRHKTTVALRGYVRGVVWQMGYYDHVLRKDEDVKTVARYIFRNPVRAGLVKDFRSYPFSGSFCFDWQDL